MKFFNNKKTVAVVCIRKDQQIRALPGELSESFDVITSEASKRSFKDILLTYPVYFENDDECAKIRKLHTPYMLYEGAESPENVEKVELSEIIPNIIYTGSINRFEETDVKIAEELKDPVQEDLAGVRIFETGLKIVEDTLVGNVDEESMAEYENIGERKEPPKTYDPFADPDSPELNKVKPVTDDDHGEVESNAVFHLPTPSEEEEHEEKEEKICALSDNKKFFDLPLKGKPRNKSIEDEIFSFEEMPLEEPLKENVDEPNTQASN